MDQHCSQNIGSNETSNQTELNDFNQQQTKDAIYNAYAEATETGNMIVDLNADTGHNKISSFDDR